MSGLLVQAKRCRTCIFRKDSPLDLRALLDQVRDPRMHGHFKKARQCHHSKRAICNGFWKAYKDHFDLGQLAQRLGVVQFVNDDVLR